MIVRPLPDSVRINGTRYDIRTVSQKGLILNGDGDEAVGLCDCEHTTLYLATELSNEGQWAALRHEAGHGSSYESGARDILSMFTKRYHRLEECLVQVWLPCYLETLEQWRK